ncbi:glutamine and serine-rich protein 1, partial [Lasius niger]
GRKSSDSDSDPTWRPYWIGKKEEERRRKEVRPALILRIRRFSKPNGKSFWKIVRTGSRVKARKSPNSSKRAPKSPILESLTCPIDAKLLASIRDPNIDISPFEPGDFIMENSDLGEKYPPLLWRIDGKTILQKFEPFELDGKTLYRSKATYAGFCTQNRHLCQRAPVKICQQSSSEVIVEFSNETSEAFGLQILAVILDCDIVL